MILPNRTGPIADVLYSAAGNSADDQYYRRGIIAYSFEAGAQRVTFNAGNQMVVTDVGFFPPFATEGQFEAMEFADGNYGLLEGALAYAKDTTPPVVNIEYCAAHATAPPINYRFTWPGEAAVIHYTTDGSTPTLASPTYENQGPRRPGEVLTSTVSASTWSSGSRSTSRATCPRSSRSVPDRPRGRRQRVRAGDAVAVRLDGSLGIFTPGVSRDYETHDACHRHLDRG